MMYVSDLMTQQVFVLRQNDTMRDGRTLMQLARIRHIPVTDNANHFEGLLTHRDLLHCTLSRFAEVSQEEQAEIESGIRVGDIMRTDVLTVRPDCLLRNAAELLYQHKYGCLPVVEEDGQLVGIITEADFLRLAIAFLQEA